MVRQDDQEISADTAHSEFSCVHRRDSNSWESKCAPSPLIYSLEAGQRYFKLLSQVFGEPDNRPFTAANRGEVWREDKRGYVGNLSLGRAPESDNG